MGKVSTIETAITNEGILKKNLVELKKSIIFVIKETESRSDTAAKL